MITASSLIALVEARGAKEATAQLLEVGAASDTAGTRMKAMAAGGLLVAGAALVGVGALSVKMAADFEQSTNLLITSAGEIPANIDLIRKGLLRMSVDTATPVDELTKGMFNIESAGYHGAAALKVEAAAAEGAKVENADLASVTDVLTTAMHNYNLPASQAVDVMNSFRLSASIGKMRMDDLTGALRNVLPIASQAGVKLSDVEAALSTMSLAGDKGASAGTHLAQMFTYLLAPSSKATGALKEVGLTTQKISDEMKVSLPGTIEMITDAVGRKFPVGSAKYIAALSAIVGGNKSMKAMLELSGISLKTFTQDASQLGPTMKANSTAVDGWNVVQGNFNFKMQAAKDAVDALMITLGTKLLPVVGQVVTAVTPLIQDFTDWVGGSNNACDSLNTLSGFLQQGAGDITTFATGIAGAVDQSGYFQAAIQSASSILPSVGGFLLGIGSAIDSNLLPPLESLITNVGKVDASIVTWIDKSGVAKDVLTDLGFAIGVTTSAAGTLVQGVADLVGFLNQDTPAADALKVSIGLLGLAFVSLKIADTVSGFEQMFSKLSEGGNIISSLASNVKGRLAKAFDDFMANQAPNLKKSMDSVKLSAQEAATAEEEVAAAPADESAAGWFARLETKLEGVGTTSQVTAGEVAASSAEMDASLEGVGTAATGAEGSIAAMGTTSATTGAGIVASFGAVAAGILTAGIAAIAGIEGYMLKDAIPALIKSWNDADFKPPPRYGDANTQMRNISRLTGSQVSSNMNTMKNNVSASAAAMYKNVVADMTDMQKQSITQGATLSGGLENLFSTLQAEAGGAFGQMSNDAYDYLRNVEAYVNQAQQDALAHQIGRNAPNIANKNFSGYASGTDYVPRTGRYMVGELGPEEVVLQQGSRVIPNDQIGHSGSGWGGGSNSQPMQINLNVDGQTFASLMVDHMGNAVAQNTRLRYGRRAW